MKNLFNIIANHLTKLIAVTAVATTVASCDDSKIFDYQDDCDPHYFVRFEYNMHMEKGNSFKEQVEAVDLWIFNEETGELVDHIYSTVADMAQTDYLLPLNVKPGNYDFVAWCGDIDNRHFKVSDNISHRTHTKCRLDKRKYDGAQAYSDEALDLLFHGKLDGAMLPNEEGTFIYTVPLVRDTNDIMLTLQHVSGEFDTEHKLITMIDNNGSMLHDNSIDNTDETILYKPWSVRTGDLENAFEGALNVKRRFDINDPENADQSAGNFMNIEMTTGRLMADHNPVITIKDSETDQIIFQIPLNKWLLQLKSAKYADMDDQEYLDRRNTHELMVLLQDDGRGGWMAVQVVINGWHMINNGEQEL